MMDSSLMDEEQVHQEASIPPTHPQSHYSGFACSTFPMNIVAGARSTKPIRPTTVLPVPPSSKMATLNLKEKAPIDPLPLSLRLPTPPTPQSTSKESSPSSSHSSPSSFQAMSGNFSGSEDSIISVA